jgi:hypothetical protein
MKSIEAISQQINSIQLASEHMKVMSGVYEMSRQFTIWQKSMFPALHQAAELGRRLSITIKTGERLEGAGWLPHYTTPFAAIENANQDEDVASILERHYEENWSDVRRAFLEHIEVYDLDAEAKAVFTEALDSHEAGHYRAAVRVLFPEIERVARLELHAGKIEAITSQKILREETGKLHTNETDPGGYYGMQLHQNLVYHLYAYASTEEDLSVLSANQVPNRHAALHGLLPYSSKANSINALIMTDYIYQVICAVKRRRNEERAEAA